MNNYSLKIFKQWNERLLFDDLTNGGSQKDRKAYVCDYVPKSILQLAKCQ